MKEMMSGMVKDAVKAAMKGSPASNARPSFNQQSSNKIGFWVDSNLFTFFTAFTSRNKLRNPF